MKDRINKIIFYFKTTPTQRLLRLIAILIILAVIPLTVYISQQKQQTKQNAQEVTPIQETEHTTPRLKYDSATEKAQFERIQKGKKNLSQRDLDVRTAIISKVPTSGDGAGVVYVGANVVIEYDSIGDNFQAEILASNINQSKTEAENWFRQQGLSNYGICNLPLSFTLSYDIESSFPQDTVFSTAPLSCPQ